jgi:anthranilate phosphoribosyltransferase
MSEQDKTTGTAKVAGRVKLLSIAVSSEADRWYLAKSHADLQRMWEKRISPADFKLTEHEAKAVHIAQACAYAIAMQQVMINEAKELGILISAFNEIKRGEEI